MQKIATRIFMDASVIFGILGIFFVATLPGPHGNSSNVNILIMRLIMADVFVILPAFALSLAAKYLNGTF